MAGGVGACYAGGSAMPLGPDKGPRERCGEASDRNLGVVMSKIPQGEWSAIAARYAKGESISRIAQSYGCTPPAIHYILKRSRQRAAQNPEPRTSGVEDSTALARTAVPQIAEHAIREAAPSNIGQAAVPPVEPRPVPEPARPTPGGQSQPLLTRQEAVRTRGLTGG